MRKTINLAPTGWMTIRARCIPTLLTHRSFSSDFDPYIGTDTLVIGDSRNSQVWVNYRAGDAELVAEYWTAWDDDSDRPQHSQEYRQRFLFT